MLSVMYFIFKCGPNFTWNEKINVFTIRVLFITSVYDRMLVSFMLLVYILIHTSHQRCSFFYVLKQQRDTGGQAISEHACFEQALHYFLINHPKHCSSIKNINNKLKNHLNKILDSKKEGLIVILIGLHRKIMLDEDQNNEYFTKNFIN